MTIDNLISWLQEAEDNNTWLVSTQSVKRHLEKIKETEQLTLTNVVKSLPNKEKLNFEDWLEFKKIDKLSDGAYRWEGSLYTEYYVKSSYETYLK